MHEANALTKRIFKYVFSVLFLSFLFTITRFFEARVSYIDDFDEKSNSTEEIVVLEPTEMRTNPIYTTYFNWSRLIVLGIIPFVLLVFLNASIYKDIKARRHRRMAAKHRQAAVQQQPRQALTVGKLSSNTTSAASKSTSALDNGQTKTNGNSNAKKDTSDHENDVELKPLTDQGEIVKVVQPKPPPPPSTISVNESRCKKEDNMAVIFMGFILVFLVCHLPRLLLNIHELATIRNAMKCMKAEKNPFPLWSQLAISVSHVLLAINSSTNIFIYCFLSSKFREECVKLYQSLCRKVCTTQWQGDVIVETPKTQMLLTQT